MSGTRIFSLIKTNEGRGHVAPMTASCSLVPIQITVTYVCLTLSAPHGTIVAISRLVEKVPSQELLSATEFSVRLV